MKEWTIQIKFNSNYNLSWLGQDSEEKITEEFFLNTIQDILGNRYFPDYENLSVKTEIKEI